MPSIVDNPKYGEGHQVVLKDKLSSVMVSKLRESGYAPGKDVFKITLKQSPKPEKSLTIAKGEKSVLLIDKSNSKLLLKVLNLQSMDCLIIFLIIQNQILIY